MTDFILAYVHVSELMSFNIIIYKMVHCVWFIT